MTLSLNDIDYEWSGGFGAILKSRERGLKVGDCRVIQDKLFYISYIWKRDWFKKPEVCWIFVGKLEIEDIRKFKNDLLSL